MSNPISAPTTPLSPGCRICIVGVTGSGKSTLARTLARGLNLQQIELDSLFWLPGWVEPDPLDFRRQLEKTLDPAGCWVIDGNYSKVQDLTWSRADTLIWLDYPLGVCFWRLFKRTLHRIGTRETLWGTNRENARQAFFSRDSLFLWAVKSQKKHRAVYPLALAQPQFAHLTVIHLQSPAAARRWLNSVLPQARVPPWHQT